jgi:hypothetical protein
MKSIKIEDLLPDDHNPRQRTERGEEVLGTSLEKYGAARSIVIDKDGVVRAGNGTLEAAKAAGIKEVVVIDGAPDKLVAVRRADWDKNEAEGYSVMDNKSADLAEWNYPVLSEKLKLPGMEPDAFGFLQTEVDAIDANASWMGTGVDQPEAGLGKQTTKAFEMVKIQVTILDESRTEEIVERLETALEEFTEGVMVEVL